MSNLFRLLCATLIVLLVIRCSQSDTSPWQGRIISNKGQSARNFGAPRGKRQDILSQMSGGSPAESNLESVTEEETGFNDDDKRAAWFKLGKRGVSNNYKIYRQNTRLGKRSEEEEAELDDDFDRIARAGFLRIGRAPFLRFGRAPSDSTFLRFGRGKTFLRIGRDQEAVKRFLRFGRSGSGSTWLRIGKRIINGMSNGDNGIGSLTPEEIQLLLANKDVLLKLFEANPNLNNGGDGEDDGYFAFPRQGRAMSFYFPRLGRSGDDDSKSGYCCSAGVRGVMSADKGEFEICPRDQSCCPGFNERTKRYKDIYIVECATMESDMENIRAYIGDE